MPEHEAAGEALPQVPGASTSAERRARSLSSSTASSQSEDAYGSTAALVLVPDDPELFLGFDNDDDDEDILSSGSSSRYLSDSVLGLAPLPVYSLMLLLVTPSLLLGARFLPSALQTDGYGFFPIPLGIAWFALFAFLAGFFSNHIWIMLGRYMRKWSIEEVVAHALIGGGGRRNGSRETWRKRLSKLTSISLAGLCVLGCVIYLREAVDVLLTYSMGPRLLGRTVATFGSSIILFPFLMSSAIAAKRMLVVALVSVSAYLTMVILMIANGPTERPNQPTRRGPFDNINVFSLNWEGFGILAFTAASPLYTYPLYMSRVSSLTPIDTTQKYRRLPYSVLLFMSAILSCLLLLPLFLVATKSTSPNPVLSSLALLCGLPPLWSISLSPRLPNGRMYPNASGWRCALWMFIVLVAIAVPPVVARIARHIFILSILLLAYAIPAFLHIIVHTLRPPLSILISVDDDEAVHTDGVPRTGDGRDSDPDSLLRRKERSLQRKRLGRRIAWDLGVWVLLAPIGIAVGVWATGRLFGRW